MILLGCSEACDYELTELHQAGTAVRTTARIDVTGMMCAHACGGKIKKELLEVQGVANAVIDFELDRDLNYAEVEFDPAQVQLDELVAAVTGIAEGKLYGVENSYIQQGHLKVMVRNDDDRLEWYKYSSFEDMAIKRNELLNQLLS